MGKLEYEIATDVIPAPASPRLDSVDPRWTRGEKAGIYINNGSRIKQFGPEFTAEGYGMTDKDILKIGAPVLFGLMV